MVKYIGKVSATKEIGYKPSLENRIFWLVGAPLIYLLIHKHLHRNLQKSLINQPRAQKISEVIQAFEHDQFPNPISLIIALQSK